MVILREAPALARRVALFEVFMVYGEDRDNTGVQHKFVVADDAKQAEAKSGLVVDPAWDFDYGTMFSRPICEVNVKEKPLEVASGSPTFGSRNPVSPPNRSSHIKRPGLPP